MFKEVNGLTLEIDDKWVEKEYEELPETLVQGPFDFLPVQMTGHGIQESVIKDVVPKNREHLNKKSARDNINYYQAFQRLASFGIEPDEMKAWAENLMLVSLNENARIQAIDGGNPVALNEDLGQIRQDAILTGLMRFHTLHRLATRQTESAESKKQDSITFEKFLNYVSDVMESTMTHVLRIHAKFENINVDVSEVNLSLGRKFALCSGDEELAEEMALFTMLNKIEDGLTVQKELIVNKLCDIHFVGSDDKSADEIRAEMIEVVRASSSTTTLGISQRRPALTTSAQIANATETSDSTTDSQQTEQ